MNELIELENEVMNSKSDFDPNNKKDHTCREIDEWFNGLLKEQLERGLKNDHAGSKASEETKMLHDKLKMENEKTSQHGILELGNQLLCLERLHWCYKNNLLKSAY